MVCPCGRLWMLCWLSRSHHDALGVDILDDGICRTNDGLGSESATPSGWKNNKTKGYMVLPLVNEYCEVGPTPLYWEVSSQNGKEHSMSIECSVSGDRIYTSDFTVEASGTLSIPPTQLDRR